MSCCCQNEELHLLGGTWHWLLNDNVSIARDMYFMIEIVTYYLVIPPVKVEIPRPLNEEENIEIVQSVL